MVALEDSGSSSIPGGWITRQPLTAFFVIAFVFSWIVVLPKVLGTGGMGIIPLDLPVVIPVLAGGIVGPFLSALIVTRAVEGGAGVRALLRRVFQWRVSILWYAVVLLIFPIIYLIAALLTTAQAAMTGLADQWSLLLTFYLPTIIPFLFIAAVFEEVGWRGFALPRLEKQYGPLLGTLILGLLWAIWHLPAYFVNGWLGPFSLIPFLANSLSITASTFVFVWVYNNARGSLLLMTVLHAASNATLPFILRLVPEFPIENPLLVGLIAATAVVIIVLTGGRLSYTAPSEA